MAPAPAPKRIYGSTSSSPPPWSASPQRRWRALETHLGRKGWIRRFRNHGNRRAKLGGAPWGPRGKARRSHRPGGFLADTGISIKPSSPLQAGRSGGLQALFTASGLFKEGQQGVIPAPATRGVLGPAWGARGGEGVASRAPPRRFRRRLARPRGRQPLPTLTLERWGLLAAWIPQQAAQTRPQTHILGLLSRGEGVPRRNLKVGPS